MQLVGREEALAVMASALDRVAGGRPALVVIEGAPGMGKTTLISRYLFIGASSGWRARAGSKARR